MRFDRETNSWLLDETLQAMEQIEHPLVQKFARSLRRHQDQLLTFLDWAAEMLTPFHQMLEAQIPDPARRQYFVRSVARCWRLRQALINGQRSRKRQAAEAEALLQGLLDENEACSALTTLTMSHYIKSAGSGDGFTLDKIADMWHKCQYECE